MTEAPVEQPPVRTPWRRRVHPMSILLLGVIAVPAIVAVTATFVWGADAQSAGDYVRVYFGEVAAQTIAAAAAASALVVVIVRRARAFTILLYAGVAFVVVLYAVSRLGVMADDLVRLLGLDG